MWGERIDKLLDVVAIVSTCIVFLLIYDEMGSMLSPYFSSMINKNDIYKIGLFSDSAKNCTNHQHHHYGDDWHKSPLQSKPRYNMSAANPKDDFCTRLPADISAAHLWNEHLEWILQAIIHQPSNTADNSDDDDSVHDRVLATAQLLQFLTPSHYLERGHRSRPSQRSWGHLLDKIHARMKSSDAPVVRVLAFGVTGCAKQRNNSDNNNMDKKGNCLWLERLELLINTILNLGVSPPRQQGQHRPIISITPVYQPADIATTVEWNTDIVRHGGLWRGSTNDSSPDVILSLYSAQNMFLPKRNWNTAKNIHYYHQQRHNIQQFMRACWDIPKCDSSMQHQQNQKSSYHQSLPLIISVDDYVGSQQGPIMAENVQARVLQLLSDYYETAFVSYAQVIRQSVYATAPTNSTHTEHHSFVLEHTSSPKNWTSMTPSSPMSSLNSFIQHNGHVFIGPIAMTLTLAYSMLKFTVNYCSAQSIVTSTQNSTYEDDNRASYESIMPSEVMQLANEIRPPELTTDLCLNNISDLWRVEKIVQDQRNDELCKNHPTNNGLCAFAFWGGQQSTKQDLDAYLQPFLHGTMDGWESRDGGRLVATRERASLHFRFGPLMGEKVTIRLFSTSRDGLVFAPAKLQWELSSTAQKRTRARHRKLLKINTTTTPLLEVRQRRFLQQQSNTSGARSGMIDGTHDSPATVALPTTIQLEKDLLVSATDLKLKLIQGNSFEIRALFACSNQ